MQLTNYHKNIVDYYAEAENAYKDSWDLNNSLAIHYGYWDNKVKSFPQSLLRMNEVMAEVAKIKSSDVILDAGCGMQDTGCWLASTSNLYRRTSGGSPSDKRRTSKPRTSNIQPTTPSLAIVITKEKVALLNIFFLSNC